MAEDLFDNSENETAADKYGKDIPDNPVKPQATPFEKWYRTYPRKVSRGAAEKTWGKITKGMSEVEEEEFSLTLRNATKAQIEHYKRAREVGDFVPDWKHPSTWLNGMCWEDEFDSYTKKKGSHARELKKCSVDGCDDFEHGAGLGKCTYHYSMDAPSKGNIFSGNDLRNYLRSMPHLKKQEGEMIPQWIGRMRRFCKARVKKIGGD